MNELLEQFDQYIARPIANWLESAGIGQPEGAILGGVLLLFLLIMMLRRAPKSRRGEPSVANSQPRAPRPSSRLTVCPACDADISVNALSCPSCGEPFATEDAVTVRCPSCSSTDLVVRREGTGCFVAILVGFLVFLGFLCIAGPFALPRAFVTSLLMGLLDGKRDTRCCRQCGARTRL